MTRVASGAEVFSPVPISVACGAPPQSAANRRTARPTSLSSAPNAQPSVSSTRAVTADTTSGGNSSNRTECASAASASNAPVGAAPLWFAVWFAVACIAVQNAKRLEPPSTGITAPVT